jgi:RecA-family ATPase
MPTLADETVLRLALRRSGFHPLPLTGKRPALDKWSQLIDLSAGQIELWAKLYPYSENTGVLTRNTPTIDIDIMIPEAAEAIEGIARDMFEESGRFCVRFGRSPKRAIPLRTNEPFKKLATNLIGPAGLAENKVELLCDGQQVAVHGMHPETNKPYTWHGGELGVDVTWEELPYIHPHEAVEFIRRASELLVRDWGFTHQAKPDGHGKANGVGADFRHADWSALMVKVLGAIDLHDSIRDLSASFIGSGISVDASVRILQSLMLACPSPHDDRWLERFHDITRATIGAHTKFRESTAKPVVLRVVDILRWMGIPMPIRLWSVYERIPSKQTTLLSGEGSVGKTILELQLCVATVLGLDWIGTLPEKGPAVYIGAEDDEDELHRRLAEIIKYYAASYAWVNFAALANNGLHLMSFAGEDCVLAAPNRNGQMMPTPLYAKLLEFVSDIKPKHIGIDTLADTFGGNEIDRTQVRQYVGLLRKLAIASGGAVVLLAHPSLTGINTGTGLSGSTGWHNSVRARMFFKAAKDGDDDTVRELEFMKNNYGPLADTVKLRYCNGVFVPVGSEAPLDKAHRERAAEEKFLDVFAKLVAQGRQAFSTKKKASDEFAPYLVANHPDGKQFSWHEYEQAMERLLANDKLYIVQSGSPSKPRERLVMGPKPDNDTS